jgi:hypothetical protein
LNPFALEIEMKLLHTVPLLASLLLTSGTATAQRSGGHHGYPGGQRPVYHGMYYGHSAWNYVVPFYLGFGGGYYIDGPTYYYTPEQIVPTPTEPIVPTTPAVPPVTEPKKPVKLIFGAFAYYPDLSGRLAAEVNALCLDLHHNFQDNKNFAEAYAEAYSVLEFAKGLEADKGDHDAIAKRAAEAHRKYHHFMSEVAGWTRSPKKQVGADGLDEKMARGEAILHHLLYDVGVKQEEQAAGAPLTAVDPKEEAPRPSKR